MNLFSLILSLFIAISPSSQFDCDGDQLLVTIRNNLNGDFALVTDLEEIDEGAFVVLDWNDLSLMLPVSFQKGEISFTDKKWLWSYQDKIMIGALLFLVFSGLYYIWLWLDGFRKESNSDEIKQPWE